MCIRDSDDEKTDVFEHDDEKTDVFEQDDEKTEDFCDDSMIAVSGRTGSSSSIGCSGAAYIPGGRAGRRRSAKVSVCSNISIRTVSEGTPPYISIMSRKDSVAVEMAAPVPDHAWVGQNPRFVKKKGRGRKKNSQQAYMFEDYQKRVQERINVTNTDLEEECEEKVKVESEVTTNYPIVHLSRT